MTFACTDCSQCGKCYEKHSTCGRCGTDINLLDMACQQCGEPITDEMRNEAKRKYIEEKKREKDYIKQLALEAKKRREAQPQRKVVYPWEK